MSLKSVVRIVSFITLTIFLFTNILLAAPDFGMLRAPMKFGELNMKQKMEIEKAQANMLTEKLSTPLDAHGNPEMAKRFLKGGYKQDGYGVPEGSSINGSFNFKGEQGYYTDMGRQVFLETVAKMRDFFKNRSDRLGKPIRYIIKPGIGGQHTPFQAIADLFEITDLKTGKTVQISGEYELGKDFEESMTKVLNSLNIDWDQVAVIPSSKSGSTDETMMVFVEIFNVLLKHQAIGIGVDGDKFAGIVLDVLHEVNFINEKERPAGELFKIDQERFGTTSLITVVYNNAKTRGIDISREQVKSIFGKVIGNMFFETTDRVDQSRLSAFIRNSGLGDELGQDAPGFGAMFDNVGGRWTGDLHMMTFLAYYGLDAEAYWKIRNEGIRKAMAGKHISNRIADKILDEGITDIALVVPDEFFWFGKSNEQNFNESIWQVGFSNLIAISKSQWEAQKKYYKDNPKKLVIDMTGVTVFDRSFNAVSVKVPNFKRLNNQEKANALAELFTTFYGMTSRVGNRLIVRALEKAGHSINDVDLDNLDNPATKIVQENLYLRQPYVELGKGLLENRLKELQKGGQVAIDKEYENIKALAGQGKLETNIGGLDIPGNVTDLKQLSDVIRKASEFARANGRKFVPFIYLEGGKFYNLRDYLISLGAEWVMQGTGDQHISYQQVLAQPQKYLPFIVSFVAENPIPGKPAIGFAKGYLHNVSSNLVRDLFAEASYQALTDLRKQEGGQGFFLRIIDSKQNIDMIGQAMHDGLSVEKGKITYGRNGIPALETGSRQMI